MNRISRIAAGSFAAMSAIAVPMAGHAATVPVRNIVLVHGAFADGSGWQPLAAILQKAGYKVSIVQEPETSLADDVAATKRVLDGLDGPAVLVGHSYGGAIITEAGNNPHVASLVYVAAFAPDEGQTLGGLNKSAPPATADFKATADGYAFLDPAKFHYDFAADLPAAQAQFMAISQVPVSLQVFGTPITAPAWKTKPTYGIIATEDRMINPKLERSMYTHAHATITAIKGSHVIFLSQPAAVAKVIEQAAQHA